MNRFSLGRTMGISTADAAAVVALVTLFVRCHLVLLSQADGWSYGAANIGLAAFLWGMIRTSIASGIETEGHDGATRHGAKHESPVTNEDSADAQPMSGE